MSRRRAHLHLLLLLLLLERKCPVCGHALALKPEAVCVKDECSFGDGSCWLLYARLQLQESILLERAQARAPIRDLMGSAGTY